MAGSDPHHIPGGFPDQADTSIDGWTSKDDSRVEPKTKASPFLKPEDQFEANEETSIYDNESPRLPPTKTWEEINEEEDLAKAIERSLGDQKDARARAAEAQKAEKSQMGSKVGGDENNTRSDAAAGSDQGDFGQDDLDEAAEEKKPRSSLNDLADLVALRLSNEFTPIFDVNGDTLVYIGPPSKTNDQSYTEYAKIKKHFDRFHRVDSRKLRDLDSDKISSLLTAKRCVYAEKRFKKLDAYQALSQDVKDAIKYHIELRPPSEDDQAVLLLTELSCSLGIRSWHLAQTKYKIPVTAVSGTDHLDTEASPYYLDTRSFLKNGHFPEVSPQDPSKIPEYSALRHHSALERILHALYGDDPKLDSAPKMWTFFATANYFKFAHHPCITKWIFAWFTLPGNRNFIQNNPEVSYRIGMGTMDVKLVNDAFSILVGEKALIDICSEMSGMILQHSVTVHGRKQENLDDDEQNRISHAASSLVHRITDIFRSVVVDLDWIYTSKEYQKLLDVKTTSTDEEIIVQEAKRLLQAFVKGRFLKIIRMGLAASFSDLDLRAHETALFRHGTRLANEITYSTLHQEARPFTRSFWIALSRARFYEGRSNVDVSHIEELKDVAGSSDNNGIKRITRAQVDDAIMDVNTLLARRDASSQPGPSLHKGYLSPGKVQVKGGNHSAPSQPQPAPEDTLVELLESPKRTSHDTDSFPTSPGKRRKTIDDDSKSFTLPYRPAAGLCTEPSSNMSNATYSIAPEDAFTNVSRSRAKSGSLDEDMFDGGLFSMDDVTNQPVSAQSGTNNPHYTTLPPPAARQHLYSRPTENMMPSSAEVSRNARQTSGYVPDFDPQSGLPVMKWKTVDKVFPPAPRSELRDKEAPGSDMMFSHGAPAWNFDPKTRTWILPKKLQDFPQVAQQAVSQGQGLAATSDNGTRVRKPVQQFSNTNTPIDWPNQPSNYNNPYAPPPGSGPKPKNQSWNPDEPWFGPPHHTIRPHRYPLRPQRILEEFSQALHKGADELVNPAHLFHGTEHLPVDLIDHLMDLSESEIKFLPLWAGGCDDGTGGVFDDMDVPNLEAGGFRGGKRGISNVSGMNSEGSVSGSESSYDDIASDAVSTVGKASKAATRDHAETVMSLSDTESDAGYGGAFENNDALNEAVWQMKADMAHEREQKMRDLEAGFDVDDDEGDVSTIMGAASDVQGEMFGDIDDDDDDDGNPSNGGAPFDQSDDIDAKNNAKVDVKGKGKAVDLDSEDDDMEIIDKNTL